MTRYAKQRRRWDCGPVAFLNTLKWLGYKRYKGKPVTLDCVKSVYRPLVKYKPPTKGKWFAGVYRADLIRAIRTISGVKVSSISYPTWAGVKDHVNSGGAVIVLAVSDPKDIRKYPIHRCKAHYSLITSRTRNQRYALINYSRDRSVTNMTCKTIRKVLWDNSRAYYAIYIRKVT